VNCNINKNAMNYGTVARKMLHIIAGEAVKFRVEMSNDKVRITQFIA